MSGTTPNGGSEQDPQSDPFTQPVGRPPERHRWRESQSLSWEDSTTNSAEPGQRTTPKAILTAAKLMYVGAVFSVLFAVMELMNPDGRRELYAEQNPEATASEVDSAVGALTTYSVAVWVIATVLWVWMAWANKKGRSWARIVSTILGALNIMFIGMGAILAGGFSVGTLISMILPVLAIVILYMLYRPESGEFYRKTSSRIF